MQKWEYLQVTWMGPEIWVASKLVTKDKNANPMPYFQQLGDDGWEMVGAVSESVSVSGGMGGRVDGGIRWYFKRPKS